MQKKHTTNTANTTTTSPARWDVASTHASHVASFTQALQERRWWHVLPAGETDTAKAAEFFDSTTGLLYKTATIQEWENFRNAHPFLYLQAVGKNEILATLQSKTGFLWNNDTSEDNYGLDNAQKIVAEGRWAGLSGWQLPSKEQLNVFATAGSNPHRSGRNYRIVTKNSSESDFWMTNNGGCDVDEGRWNFSKEYSAYIFSLHPFFINKSAAIIVLDLLEKQWQLKANNGQVFNPQSSAQCDTRWQGLAPEALLQALRQDNLHLISMNTAGQTDAPRLRAGKYSLREQFIAIDHRPCRLPLLDEAQLSDPEQGLWELWGQDAALLKRFNLVARDPGRDIREQAVAIDFGTSSTVVAVDTPTGRRELLRMGVRDFFQSVQPADFENPTVLECLDWPAFHAAWSEYASRPALDWDWMRAAHEAQANWRDNPGDTTVLASILPRIKQWALRDNAHNRLRLNDRQGHEIEVPLHTERNPVRGQPPQVSADDPFDPVELYAWYLGMAINWRGAERGIYLKYFLSFPVKYPLEVKNRILASFRRGLLRSLPDTLITHHPEVLHRFKVEDLASEPAAYAAAALTHLQVEPTDAGVPYAVFDFGGGTSDFDFGLLRWATDEEDAQGYERVFEHLDSSGDNYLGGENLLEHLVYESFCQNLEVLRKHRIQFVRPMDAQPFAGSEAFLAHTQAAQTNTVMLAARLRSFMEGDKPELPAQIKLDFIDSNNQKQACELVLDAQALDDLLAQRIRRGVEAFLACLAQVQPDLPAGSQVQVLLAGNGCRSRHIRALFDPAGELWPQLLHAAFGDTPPAITVHAPLPMNASNPHAPTAKTGVALGLLRVMPGENTLLMNHVHTANDGQAPFAWFIGRMRRGRFAPVMEPGAAYGQWQAIGPLQAQVFNLLCSNSPRARSGLAEGDAELHKRHLEFADAPEGATLYARPTGPHRLELAAALSLDSLAHQAVRVLEL